LWKIFRETLNISYINLVEHILSLISDFRYKFYTGYFPVGT